MKHALILVVILVIAVLGLGGWYLFTQQSKLSQSNASPSPIGTNIPSSGPITISGQLVCLPHLNTNGPQTEECAYGLKDNLGRYFALHDSDPMYKNIGGIPTNSKVEIEGDFTPQQDSKYQNIGIINIAKVNQLFP